MVAVMGQMAILIFAGVFWRIIKPGGPDADLMRTALTTLVFNLLMPAMVLLVLWQADIGFESVLIALYGCLVVLAGIILFVVLTRFLHCGPRTRGAAILAVAFPNVTYLGLPLLEQTFGPWTRSLVIQIDLFAVMPVAMTVGVLVARHFGEDTGTHRRPAWHSLLRNPPLWSAFAAILLNRTGLDIPDWLLGPLQKLSAAVVPLMLISLGLGLRLESWRWHNAALSAAVIASRLALVPLLGLALGASLGFTGDKLNALVLEAAMPSMLLGIAFCDRYKLDTAFYAMSVALTTLAAAVSLPLWHHQVQLVPAGLLEMARLVGR